MEYNCINFFDPDLYIYKLTPLGTISNFAEEVQF